MKAKIALATLFVLAVGLLEGYAQNEPSIDDKMLVMKEIEGLPEVKASNVERHSVYFGYTSYGAPWASPALHGGSLGFSLHQFMLGVDFGFGNLIEDNAYDNTTAYEYLKDNSAQGFAFLSFQWRLIKYLSFGAGIGFHTELRKDVSSETTEYNHYSIETDKITFANRACFGLRLGAKAYIPLSDKLAFYLSGDYDVMPSSARKSKLDLGIGLKIAID